MSISTRNLLLSAALLAAGGTSQIAAQDLPTLYGTMIYSDAWWDGNEYGVYAIDLNSKWGSPVQQASGYGFNANAGAAYFNGTYVVLNADDYGNVTYYEYETDSWEQTDEDELPATFMALDFALDPTDGTTYGVCSDGNGGIELAKVNFPARQRTAIGRLSQQIIALAINSTGKMYGITGTGRLVTINKSNATITEIGATGISPDYMQSATFDLATDRLYWAASFEDDMEGPMAGIYEVDTTTGRATRIKRLSNCEEFVGLYCLNEAAVWSGPDYPAAPADFTADIEQNGEYLTAQLSWTAPTTGIHNGEITPEALTYTLVRMPEAVTVAEGLTECSYTDSFTRLPGATFTYYVVRANNGDLEGEAAETARYSFTGVVTLPYTEDFSNEGSFGSMVVVDADGDGYTWNFTSGCAVMPGAPFEYSSEWLFTPEFRFESDRLYRVEADFSESFAANYPFNAAAYVGKGTETSDYTSQVFVRERINSPEVQHMKGYARVDESGDYRIALRGYGYDIQDVELDNIKVSEGPRLTAPAAPASLTVTSAPNGAIGATLAFTAAATDVAGAPVAGITSANIYRDDVLIATVDVNGAEGTFTDAAPAANAVNRYAVAFVNAAGEGLDAEASTYVGVDTPSAPANVHLADAGSKVVLTWDAPTVGINGGYVDPSSLTYHVYNASNGSTIETSTTSYEITMDTDGDQQWFYFNVSASNAVGTSPATMSNPLVSGTPYALPFYEGFPGGERTHFWGARSVPEENNYSSWYVMGGDDADGNGGYANFQHGMEGNRTHFFSGKISLAGAENPVLEFFYIYRAEENEKPFNTYVITNGNDTTLVDSREYVLYMHSKPFEKVRVPLSQFKDADYIQLLFDGYTGDVLTLIQIDGIEVRDWAANDLRTALTADHETAVPADVITLTATVENIGSASVSDYNVEFYDGDRLLATLPGSEIVTDQKITYTLQVEASTLQDVYSFSAVAACPVDELPDNNTSNTVEVAVVLPQFPAPDALSATVAGNTASLSWTEPWYTDFAVAAVEGAEACDDLSAELGEWTSLDRDGANTITGITVGWDYFEIEGLGAPMGFVAIDPAAHEIPFINFWDEPTGWEPRDGSKIFVSFASSDTDADDWLISPELTGDAQTVTFSLAASYSDSYEVLYSTTTADPDEFTSILSGSGSNTWTDVSIDLPEGARYFAIRNNSSYWGAAVRVDKITYTPATGRGALELEGYNVYCDYELVGQCDTPAFDYDMTAPGEHLFHVTARYNFGESSAAAVTAEPTSGIVDAAAGSRTEVGRYNVQGQPVGSDFRGIVIVRYSDGTAAKHIVE